MVDGGDNSADFIFTTGGDASATDVVVHFTREGNADPSDYTGLPASDEVTIPAGQDTVEVPVTAVADNLIKPTLELQAVPVEPGPQPNAATMTIVNSNQPTVTIGGATTNATFPLDIENDTSEGKLVAVSLKAPTRKGDPATFTLSWRGELRIWGTPTPSAADMADGHDLGWNQMPGQTSEQQNHQMTWNSGDLPQTVYAQAIGSGQSVDSTTISLSADVFLEGLYGLSPEETHDATASASGTVEGVEIVGDQPTVFENSYVPMLVVASPISIASSVQLSIENPSIATFANGDSTIMLGSTGQFIDVYGGNCFSLGGTAGSTSIDAGKGQAKCLHGGARIACTGDNKIAAEPATASPHLPRISSPAVSSPLLAWRT